MDTISIKLLIGIPAATRPNTHPAIAYKTAYFLDARYRDKKGLPLFDIHPDYADKPLPRPIDFTKAGLDIGAVLNPIFNSE